jgi:tRNA C32,U32 (ribose-2'-O)-methylase TrmJ
MSIYAQYRPDPNSWETVDTRVHLERYEKDALTDESLDTALREIQEWVTNVKPEEERKREEFLASLGRLIDRGRSIGIEVDFLNPLVESMRQLSENILTDQR